MAPDHMATRWLAVWLTGVGIHGLRPQPTNRCCAGCSPCTSERSPNTRPLSKASDPDQAAMADQILREVIATQKDTLRRPAQVAIQEGDLLAVRSAEIAAIVWTLAGLDAFADPADSLAAWRERLHDAAASATRRDQLPAMLSEVRRG